MMALLQTKISAQFWGQFPKVFIKKWFLLLSSSSNSPFLLSTPNSHAWICHIMNSNWLVISGTSSTQVRNVYIYIYIYVYTRVCVHIYICVCVCVCVYIYIYIYIKGQENFYKSRILVWQVLLIYTITHLS